MASYLDKTGLTRYDSKIKEFINNRALGTNHPNLLNCTNMGGYNWEYITKAANSTLGYDSVYIGHQQWGNGWGRQGLYFIDQLASSGGHTLVAKFNNYIFDTTTTDLYLDASKKYQLSLDVYAERNSAASGAPSLTFYLSGGDDTNFNNSTQCVWSQQYNVTEYGHKHLEFVITPDKTISSPQKIFIKISNIKACHFWDLMLREYDEILDANTVSYLSWSPNPADELYMDGRFTWHKKTESTVPSNGIRPFIYYDFGVQTNLTIDIDRTYMNMLPSNRPSMNYFFQFTNPSDSTTTLTVPGDFKWANGEVPTWNPGDVCQVSVVNYCAVLAKFRK